MDKQILTDIEVNLPLRKVTRALHMGEESGQLNEVKKLIDRAYSLIHPRAMYTVAYIDEKNKDTVHINGIEFTSRILRKNLDKLQRVFPYVVTIGGELEREATSYEDLMKQYYLNTIADLALGSIMDFVEDELKEKYRLGQLSRMNPGSLKDWPITQQQQLFSIIGDVEESIGVRLNESFLMIPRKSTSGIFFPTEVKFYNCQLCPRENCPGRKASYDENLAREYMEKV